MTNTQKIEVIYGRPFCVITMTGEYKYITLRHIRIKDIPTAVINKTDYRTIIDLCTKSGMYNALFSDIHPISLNELYLSCLDLNKNGALYQRKQLTKKQQEIKAKLEKINKIKRSSKPEYTIADTIADVMVITGFSLPKILDMSLEEVQLIMASKIRMDTVTGENLSRRICQTLIRMLGVKTDSVFKEYEKAIKKALTTGLEQETNTIDNIETFFASLG